MIRLFKLSWILLFLAGVAIPLFHMNTAEITEQENRTLAKFPEIRKQGKFNSDYGKEFETWLGDHFWGRNELINARFQTLYKINGRIENEKAFIGDDGWMFEKSKTVNIPSVEKQREKIKKDAKILKKFADKFKNIPIYLVIIPDREELYQKYWEKYYKPKPKLDYGKEIIKYLSDYPSIKVIYPKKEFLNSSEYLFRKYDFHMNSLGGELFVKCFYNHIKRDLFPNKSLDFSFAKPRMNSKTSWRPYIARLLGLKELPKEYTQAINIITVSPVNDKSVDESNGYKEVENQHSVSDRQAYVLGDCYAYDTLFPLIRKLFKKSYLFRTNMIEDFKNQYDRAKHRLDKIPDNSIIILVGPSSLDFINKLNSYLYLQR